MILGIKTRGINTKFQLHFTAAFTPSRQQELTQHWCLTSECEIETIELLYIFIYKIFLMLRMCAVLNTEIANMAEGTLNLTDM